tara:strand:- start:20576 stop:21019 length:444 start_codon:yes stop_codon:yes gene_type:complete
VKNVIGVILVSLTIFMSNLANASTTTDSFASCLVNNLNGEERKGLAKWTFFSIAAHPEIKPYSQITSEQTEATDEYAGKLITRLLTRDCPAELKAAYKANPLATQRAFVLVGEVAMQELINDSEVNKKFFNYIKYVDKEKIKAIISE